MVVLDWRYLWTTVATNRYSEYAIVDSDAYCHRQGATAVRRQQRNDAVRTIYDDR